MHILTDAADVRRCRECDKAICSHCVQTHGRQPQTVSHALTAITSAVREREVLEEKLVSLNRESQASTEAATIDLQPAVFLGSSVNASNDSSALAHSIGHALCSNGCDGINFDSIATHWCRECDQAICSVCAVVHSRQVKSKHHVLTEISVLLSAQQDLEKKAARVREDALEHTRRMQAEEDAREREIQELEAAKAKAASEAAEMKAAAEREAERRSQEIEREAERRSQELEAARMKAESEAAEMKAAAEKEAERRKEEEDEILLEKHMLEEALARVQAHSFRRVLSRTSPRTKEVQETLKTISHTGVAAGAVFSASASPCLVSSVLNTPRSNAIGFISPRSPAVEEFPSNLSAMTHTDASIPIDPRASPMAVSMADQHNRKVDDQLCQAQHRAEEGELVHQLQVARTSEEEICRNSEKRLLHPFLTEETIKTPIAHTGVAAASSASSTRPQLVETPRQRVPTEKMERLKIETSPDVLESRQGEADWVKRKERETDRAAEVAVDTQADHSITESVHPTGAFTLPLEAIVMPVSHTRVAVPAAPSASAPFPRSTGTETPGRAVDFSPARSAQAGLSVPLSLFLSRARALSLSLPPSLPPSLCSALSHTLTKTDLSAYEI